MRTSPTECVFLGTCLSVGTGSAFVKEKVGCVRARVGIGGREMTNACVRVLVCVSAGVCEC